MSKIQRYIVLMLVILCSFWVHNESFANPQHTANVLTQKEVIPIDSDIEVFKLTIENTTSTVNMKLSNMVFDKTGGDFSFNQFEYIKVYRDVDRDSSFNENDSLAAEKLAPVTDTTTFAPTAENIHNAIDQGSTETFWVIFKLKPTTTLADQSEITFQSVEVCDDATCTTTPLVSNNVINITATGIQLSYFDDIKPDFIFPGATNIPIAYFNISAKGDDLTNMNLTIRDINGKFSDSDDGGIASVSLVRQTNDIFDPGAYTPPDDQAGFTEVIQEISSDSVGVWSNTVVTLNAWTELTTLDKTTDYGMWLVYDFGDNIVVTANSAFKVSIMPEDFFGLNTESTQTIVTPTYGVHEIPFAGIEISDITNLSGDDVYDKNTAIPILSFKLKSHQTSSNVKKISVINNGTVPFFAAEGPAENIEQISIYYDEDQTNTLSTDLDTEVGTLILNPDSTNTSDEAPVTLNNVELSAFDNNDDNTKTFFVVYHVASNIEANSNATSNYVTAEIGDIVASGNLGDDTFVEFKASIARNNSPLSSTPVASVELVDTTIQIIETEDISETNAYDGEIKVPMLYLKFKSDVITQAGKLTIKNNQSNFYSRANGITKIWIYEDKNGNKELDDNDKFLRSTTEFTSTGEASLENIEFNNENEFLILYDIGLLASEEGDPFAAQIANIEITEGSSSVSGVLPTREVADITPINNLLNEQASVTIVNSSADDATIFNLNMTVSNPSGTAITVNKLEPKFYLSDKSGLDISYEFNCEITSEGSIPTSLAADDQLEFLFSCSHAIPYSNGVSVIDAYIEYQETESPDQKILLFRYQDGEGDWHLISGTDILQKNITSDITSADIPPSYVTHPLKLCNSQSSSISNCNNFVNGASIGENKILSLVFVDASSIDESSISLIRGNDILFQQEELNENMKTFIFDKEVNLLQFYVGEKSADISLSMSDLSGNNLPLMSLNYLISDEIEVTNPLFYPNPYILGSNNLKFGYSISRDNTEVEIYIYNHLGQVVYTLSQTVNSGLNILAIPETEDFMVPGIYICRMIAKENGEVVSSKTTKLAIY